MKRNGENESGLPLCEGQCFVLVGFQPVYPQERRHSVVEEGLKAASIPERLGNHESQ